MTVELDLAIKNSPKVSMQTKVSTQIQVFTKTEHNVIFIKTEDATQIDVACKCTALSVQIPAYTEMQPSAQTQIGMRIQAYILMKDFPHMCGEKAPRHTKASTQTDVNAIRGTWQNL
ncbi:hypothetical protein ILYODFUR_038516 [Ilyodon furcidens]|uniref:Uncharacterized protein n=1 Tax=Ilyodon furcidens TaxID=33524 RepID=A0ABV0T7F1_9TELE